MQDTQKLSTEHGLEIDVRLPIDDVGFFPLGGIVLKKVSGFTFQVLIHGEES